MSDGSFTNSYSAVLGALRERLAEPAPSRLQILSGPRQVGKTHLLQRLEREHAGRAIYAAADSPPAAVMGWWEAQWQQAAALAGRQGGAILLIDEIQHLSAWAERLKAEFDRVLRERTPLHVVVSGSSSLRLGAGARETMAGRFERLRLLHWPAAELVTQLGMTEEEAVLAAVRHGTYPGAVPLLDQPERWRRYVADAIIEPAIGRDIMAMEAVRKPALLRQVFAVAAGHPAEIVSLQKLRGQLVDAGALETIAHYLHVLEEACLIAAVPKHSRRKVRRRAAPPKLVVLNQALLVAGTEAGPVSDATSAETMGRFVENACLAHAWNAGQNVGYWRAEPLEVDLVLSGNWGKWAVEVKTGTYGRRDLGGVLEFCRRYRDYRPLVLAGPGREAPARQAGVPVCTWSEFLLRGIDPSA